MNVTQAYRAGSEPLKDFMLKHTRDEELALMTKAADMPLPKNRDSVDLRTLVPAFVLSDCAGRSSSGSSCSSRSWSSTSW